MENESNPTFQQAIANFWRQYPNINTGDLQSFVIGWQMCNKKHKNTNLPEYHEIQYHAKTLTADQFREYWKEIENSL
jgi:hypothetical protein